MSLKQIADALNSRGLTTKGKNSAWKPETVKGILVNEKYSGDALLQKTYVTDCITKTTRKNNGELPMYLVKNHHEPIISRTDFNRVQEEMAGDPLNEPLLKNSLKPSRASTAQNMHCRNCLSAESAERITDE